MRIRKHAKFSLLATPSPNPCALLHTPVCHLNQSPWDTINFSPPPTPPPPPHQGNGDGVSDGSGRRVSAPDRDEDHQQPEYCRAPPENETKAAKALCCSDSDFEEYEEEEWSRGDTGKKRGRKPI